MEQDHEGQIELPEPAERPRRSRFLLAWVAASIVGWIVGLLLGGLPLLVPFGLDWEPTGAEFGAAVSLPLALAGLVACATQGLALRGRIPRAGRWVLASSVAWILAGPVLAAPWGLSLDSLYLNLTAMGLALLVSGAMVGATQWLVVQDEASHAWRWILASAAAWCLGTIVPVVGFSLATVPEALAGLVGGLLLAASGALAGPAITGIVLDGCLREPPAYPVSHRRRRSVVVGLLWLLLAAVALPVLFHEQLLERQAARKLPECLGSEDCPRVVLPGADLARAQLKGVSLVDADLSGANLEGAALDEADLRGANLSGADLTGAALWEANLTAADLREAELVGAKLGGARLTGAQLGHANLAEADLTMAILRGADVGFAVMTKANLRGADLTGADLTMASLWGANLLVANLSEANLDRADLGVANLDRANLSGANLSGARLAGAILTGANLTGATVTAQQLAQAATLEGATMPDGTVHE